MSRVAILGYHKVGPPAPGGWETWFYVPEDVFAAQLTVLRDGGWQPLDGRHLPARPRRARAAAGAGRDDHVRRRLSLGARVALPWLERFGYPGVLFMPTDFVGRTNIFDRESEPEEPLCDWDDLRELARRGVAAESHALRIARSPSSRGRARLELERSKAVLEDGLGQTVRAVRVPVRRRRRRRRPQVLERGLSRCLRLRRGTDLACRRRTYRVERLAMGPDSELEAMPWLVSGWCWPASSAAIPSAA